MKAIILILIGAAGMYLYMTSGDMDGLIKTVKAVANEGATYVKNATD